MTEDTPLQIGVLALQGAFKEHVASLERLGGVRGCEVRRPDQLAGLDGLILPGGESTTIGAVASRWNLVRGRRRGGGAPYTPLTCASRNVRRSTHCASGLSRASPSGALVPASSFWRTVCRARNRCACAGRHASAGHMPPTFTAGLRSHRAASRSWAASTSTSTVISSVASYGPSNATSTWRQAFSSPPTRPALIPPSQPTACSSALLQSWIPGPVWCDLPPSRRLRAQTPAWRAWSRAKLSSLCDRCGPAAAPLAPVSG